MALLQGAANLYFPFIRCCKPKKVGKHWSSGLGLGPDEVGQKGLEVSTYCHSQKNETQNQKFSLQTWRLAKSFEVLKRSLAQSSAEIFLCKNMGKLLDFSLGLPEAKVLTLSLPCGFPTMISTFTRLFWQEILMLSASAEGRYC